VSAAAFRKSLRFIVVIDRPSLMISARSRSPSNHRSLRNILNSLAALSLIPTTCHFALRRASFSRSAQRSENHLLSAAPLSSRSRVLWLEARSL